MTGRMSAVLLATGLAACGLGLEGTHVDPSADAGPSDAGAPSDASDAAPAKLPATCRDALAATPGVPSGTYNVEPTGSAPFVVRCDMTTEGGGWTLVARELAGKTGQLQFLAADSRNPDAIADGTASGIIGGRFAGTYTEVWIDWGAGSFIRFARPASFDLFGNSVDANVAITSVTTNESALAGWIASAGGAKLCVASKLSDVRPGDTSWAVKPRDDGNASCGCNSGSWAGRGAFYGGAVSGQQTACGGWGGGWAGVKDNGAQKGGIVPSYETRIWIR